MTIKYFWYISNAIGAYGVGRTCDFLSKKDVPLISQLADENVNSIYDFAMDQATKAEKELKDV